MSASKLDHTVRKAISQLVESNFSLSVAAQQCGISKATACLWYKAGSEAKNGKYRQFYEAINEASDRAEQRLLDKVQYLAENGSEVRRKKITIHPNGTRTETSEVQRMDDFAVLKWLLEKRHGYNSALEKAMEKAVNRILTISRNRLSEEQFGDLVGAIAHDPVLGDVDFDKDLLIIE